MLKHLIIFYKVSSLGPCNEDVMSSSGKRRLKYLQWSTFLSATFGYGMYYVCRFLYYIQAQPANIIRYVLCLPVELECSKETDC